MKLKMTHICRVNLNSTSKTFSLTDHWLESNAEPIVNHIASWLGRRAQSQAYGQTRTLSVSRKAVCSVPLVPFRFSAYVIRHTASRLFSEGGIIPCLRILANFNAYLMHPAAFWTKRYRGTLGKTRSSPYLFDNLPKPHCRANCSCTFGSSQLGSFTSFRTLITLVDQWRKPTMIKLGSGLTD